MPYKNRVSVIVTAHNYGKYLPQSLESIFKQTYSNFEVLVVDDGSKDNTPEILEDYRHKYPGSMKVITTTGYGLAKACNTGIKEATGEYIIRLDADDYFDENILLVEANILDRDPHIHMVYPDYYQINKYGEIIDSFRLSRVNDEVKLLDRSPLAAGAMFRRECYDTLGGYSEELRYQEDYDFWIRFIDKFNVYNVNLPLMYYRKHGNSMSNNFEARMAARQYVKKKFVNEKGKRNKKKITAVIPAMGLFRNCEKLSLKPLNGKPLIAYTIEEALKCSLIDRVIVSTEDREIADMSRKFGAEVPFLRPLELSKTNVPFEKVLYHLVRKLEEKDEELPEYFIVLPYLTPFRSERHITEAIDTIILYDTDSVLSVVSDLTFHWKPGEYGLTPVGYQKRLLREDKETIYKENSSVYVVKRETIENGGYLGNKIGHIEMSARNSWRIENDFDFWVAEKMSVERHENPGDCEQ